MHAVLASGTVVGDDTAGLQQLARLPAPTPTQIDRVVEEATNARTLLAALEATDAERDARLADLREAALRFHADHGTHDEACPVCGTRDVLGPPWSLQTQAYVGGLRQATS